LTFCPSARFVIPLRLILKLCIASSKTVFFHLFKPFSSYHTAQQSVKFCKIFNPLFFGQKRINDNS